MTTKPKREGTQRGMPASRQARPSTVRAQGRPDDANAFLPDPNGGPARAPDDLSESLAEEFVEAATSGEDPDEEVRDAIVPEEIGGPFIETSAAEELADSVDEVNPRDAEPEPLPRAVAGVVAEPERDERLDSDRSRAARPTRDRG